MSFFEALDEGEADASPSVMCCTAPIHPSLASCRWGGTMWSQSRSIPSGSATGMGRDQQRRLPPK